LSHQKPSEAAQIKAAYEHIIYHLKTGGYIEARRFNLRAGDGHDSHTVTYNLTSKGAKVLQAHWDERGINAQVRFNSHTRHLTGGVQPEHWMKIKDALIAFEALAKGQERQLLGWHDDEQIKGFLKPKGYWRHRIEPDGYIHMDGLCVLLEVDMATMSAEQWRDKTRKYVELLNTWEDDPFFTGHPKPLFVFFFPSHRRMDNIRQVIEKAGGRTNFWLATFDQLADPQVMIDHRFMVATHREGYTLSFKLAFKD
jgi:hypothetical protein